MASSAQDRYGQWYYANVSASVTDLSGSSSRVNGSGNLTGSGSSLAFGSSEAYAKLYINGSEVASCGDRMSSWSTSTGAVCSLSGSATFSKSTTTRSISVKYLYYTPNTYGIQGTIDNTTSVTIPALASYTITYNANGGVGAPADGKKFQNATYYISSDTPTKTGYTFKGWNTSSDGSGTTYFPGESYTANTSVTLYAMWAIDAIEPSRLIAVTDRYINDVGDLKCYLQTYSATEAVTHKFRILDSSSSVVIPYMTFTIDIKGKTEFIYPIEDIIIAVATRLVDKTSEEFQVEIETLLNGVSQGKSFKTFTLLNRHTDNTKPIVGRANGIGVNNLTPEYLLDVQGVYVDDNILNINGIDYTLTTEEVYQLNKKLG